MATSKGALIGWKLRRLNFSTQERLWYYVDKSDPAGCWLWKGTAVRGGYGAIQIDGKLVPAHRVAWESMNGPIPDGLIVCHRCDTPPCCNPAHMFLGTHKDNAIDCVRKGRRPVFRGEQHYRAKLTDKSVREIRELYSTGEFSTYALAEKFNVQFGTISKVVLRTRWAHVQ